MDAPYTILYIITSTNTGGAEKALFELLKRLDRSEFTPYVCSVKKPGDFAKRIASQADGFYSLGMSESGGISAILYFIPALFRLIWLIRRVRPSIIHTFLFRANILGRIAGSVFCIPAVISSIRVREFRAIYKDIIEYLTSFMVDYYITVSDSCRNYSIKHAKIPPHKIKTIYNGVDSNEIVMSKIAPLDTLPVCREDKILALIGRLHRQKGHEVLIRALKTVLKRVPQARLLFIGEGQDRAYLQNIVENEGLGEYIKFLGIREDIPQILPHIAVVVLPSLWEGLPNILLEAMAAGRPVVSSKIEGIDEIVVHKETGILCPPSDVQSFAEAIVRLLEDESLAERMGAAGRKRVAEKFPVQKTVQETVTIYRHFLSEAGKKSKS